MADTVETLLVRNLHEVFGEPDAAQRRAAIAEIWAPGGVFVDAQGRFVGPDALNDVVSQLYARFPGFVFTAVARIWPTPCSDHRPKGAAHMPPAG